MLERLIAGVLVVVGVIAAAAFWNGASVPPEGAHDEIHDAPAEDVPPDAPAAAPTPERPSPAPQRPRTLLPPWSAEADEDDDDDDEDREERHEKRKGKRGKDD